MIKIMMMNSFSIETDNEVWRAQHFHSNKGIKLMRWLILNAEKDIYSEDLAMLLSRRDGTPGKEKSIKTYICRMRGILNKMSPGLGNCIVSGERTYKWVCKENIYVDALEAKKLFEKEPEDSQGYDLLLTLYQVPVPEKPEWTVLYYQYMENYIRRLNYEERFNRACEVCEHVLKLNPDEEKIGVMYKEAII